MRGFMRWATATTSIEEGFKGCFSKSSYKTEEKAQKAISNRQDKVNYTLRYYKCDICSQFHLTKAPGVQQAYAPEKVFANELEEYIDRHKKLLDEIYDLREKKLYKEAYQAIVKKKELLKEVKGKGLRIP